MIKAGLIEPKDDHTTIADESKQHLQNMWDHEMYVGRELTIVKTLR